MIKEEEQKEHLGLKEMVQVGIMEDLRVNKQNRNVIKNILGRFKKVDFSSDIKEQKKSLKKIYAEDDRKDKEEGWTRKEDAECIEVMKRTTTTLRRQVPRREWT